jgi:C4-dicarboxylate-specific signal transduction histidine kinase
MAAVGSMILHDILQFITDVDQRIDNLNTAITRATKESIENSLTSMKLACRSAITMLQEIRKVAKEGVMDKIPVDLNLSIQNWLVSVGYQLSAVEVEFQTAFALDLPLVSINDIMLRTAFGNICDNAIAVLKKGMLFSIRTAARDGGSVTIEVRDSGPGFPDYLVNTYNLPLAAKGDSKGFGFGLTIAHCIIDMHGGKLRLANHPDGGAIVSIDLPIR